MFFLIGSIAVGNFIIEPGRLNILKPEMLIYIDGFKSKIGELSIIIGCTAVLHVLGFIDDKKGLGPFMKLIVQFAVAAAAAIFADVRVEFFISSKIITTAMSVFWIVLIMNAFNFLDNMDGLSAGIAAIACSVLFTASAISGQMFIGALTIIFIGTLLGFLAHNFPPAKIFMGDSGSLIIGFFVAIITLKTTYYHEGTGRGLYAVFMPIVAMAVPLYDFISVTFLRIRQGKSPFVGDTQHFSHRLRRRGLNDRQTALTLYLATLCTGLGAIFLYSVNLLGAILVLIQTIMMLCIIGILEATGKDGPNNA